MRTDRKSGSSLKGAAGVMLTMSCAAGLPALICVPGEAASTEPAARLLTVAVRSGGAGAAAQAGESAEAGRTDLFRAHASALLTPQPLPTPRARGTTGSKDAEIAILLDWHLSANNVYGVIYLQDPPLSR